MNAGDTLHFQYSEHLWVVISDPVIDRERVLLVNFSSIKAGRPCDLSCVVNIGDHPYIGRPSFVYYMKAQELQDKEMERLVSCGQITFPYGPVGEDLLKRIREGARISKHLKRGYRQLLKDQGLI